MSATSVSTEERLMRAIRRIIPNLVSTKTKGQNGRIGIFGGSIEYTGAPYFAGIIYVYVFVICKFITSLLKNKTEKLITIQRIKMEIKEEKGRKLPFRLFAMNINEVFISMPLTKAHLL